MHSFRGNNEAVTPFVLCSLCQRVQKIYTNSSAWEETFRAFGTEAENFFPRVQHHASRTDLRESADTGCHICSLIDASLNYQLPNAEYDGNIVLIPIQLGTYNWCSEVGIEIELEANGAKETKIAIRVHRHLKSGQENYSGEPANTCFVSHAGLFDDLLEVQAGWRTNPCSSASFVMLRSWLQQCLDDHGVCGRRLSNTKPTRVLDLAGSSTLESIRMVETQSVDVEAYAALSYRWGSAVNFALSASNYEEYQSRIPLQRLPRTIREAVEICRGLDVRFLWVDALCIIQDGSDDLIHEIAQMGSIYAGSIFTLEASDATDSNWGFSRSRNPLRREEYVFDRSDDGAYWIFEGVSLNNPCGPNLHIHDIKNSHMSTRGWVFQEQVLAPRTIHFVSGDFLWSCREETFCRRCLSQKSPLRLYTRTRHHTMEKQVLMRLLEDPKEPERRPSFGRAWRDLLQNFSKTDLTSFDDRLSALAGIVQLVHVEAGMDASYGLRLDSFLDDLLWSPKSFDPQHGNFQIGEIKKWVPSWSWLSFAGPVLFSSLSENYEDRKLYQARITSYPPITAFSRISFLHSLRSRPPSFRMHGKIQACQLYPILDMSKGNLEWKFVPIAGKHSTALKEEIQRAWCVYENSESKSTQGEVSISNELPSSFFYHHDKTNQHHRELTYLLLKRRWMIGLGLVYDTGLVLERVHSEAKIYRRVGTFTSTLSNENYLLWLKKRVQREFYPDLKPNRGVAVDDEDDIAHISVCRDPSFHISELDHFEDVRKNLDKIRDEAGILTEAYPDTDVVSSLTGEYMRTNGSVIKDAEAEHSGNGPMWITQDPPMTKSAEKNRVTSMIKCLQIFNGIEGEEEAEIEIM